MVLPRGDGALTDRFGHLPCPGCQHGAEGGEEEGRTWHGLAGGEHSACHEQGGGVDNRRWGTMKYVMANQKKCSTGTRVMASACISFFRQAAVAKTAGKNTKSLLVLLLKIVFQFYHLKTMKASSIATNSLLPNQMLKIQALARSSNVIH